MTNTCAFNFSPKYGWCRDGVDKNPKPDFLNSATENKIDMVARYAAAWVQIVLKHGANGVIFFDSMCNSGSYIVKDNYPDKEVQGTIKNGTSKRIHDIFLVESSKSEYSKKNFVMILNDCEKNQLLCQCCRLNLEHERMKDGVVYQIKENYKIIFYNQDANVLLKNQYVKKLLDYRYYMLLFYDPYNCSIEWDSLEWYIRGQSIDIIINHMIIDLVRNIKTVKNEDKIKSYLEAYKEDSFENLKKWLSNKDGPEFYELLRGRIKDIVRNISKDARIASVPCFIQTNAILYDLMLISFADKAKSLFKDSAYTILNNRFKHLNDKRNSQLSFFDKRPEEFKEYELRSSIYYFTDVAFKEFDGKGKVRLDEFNKFLEEHDTLPTNCKTDLRKELKIKYGVNRLKDTIEKKWYYDFSKKEV